MATNDPNAQQILKDIAIRQQEQVMKDRVIEASRNFIANSTLD